MLISNARVFDAHLHIIDGRFPLVPNHGYLPPMFDVESYLKRVAHLNVVGGAVVSGSFQAFDQTYLLAALKALGPSFVGVTQLPASVSDKEVIDLDKAGVRAVRFNCKRSGSEEIQNIENFAKRVYEICNWHVELYIDAADLSDLVDVLVKLPRVSIDHLGLSKIGLPILLKLVEKRVKVKATGFGRIDFDAIDAIKQIASIDESALMFGTDLPSTRAKRPFSDDDLHLIINSFDRELAEKIIFKNAVDWYRPIAMNSKLPK